MATPFCMSAMSSKTSKTTIMVMITPLAPQTRHSPPLLAAMRPPPLNYCPVSPWQRPAVTTTCILMRRTPIKHRLMSLHKRSIAPPNSANAKRPQPLLPPNSIRIPKFPTPMSVSRNRTLQPRRILLPATIRRAAIRLVAAVIAAQTAAAIVVAIVEAVVAIVGADVVAVGAVVALEAVAVVDIVTARVDEIYLPQNMHLRRVTAIPAAT